MGVKHTEVLTVVSGSWVQLEPSATALSGRKYLEILNQAGEDIGIIYGGSNPGGAVAWNSGEVVLAKDKTSLAPADATVPTWARSSASTLSTAGSAPILREWS